MWLKKLALQSALKVHRKEIAFTESEESNEVLMFARLPLLLVKGLPSMCTPLALIHPSGGLHRHQYLVRSPSSYLDRLRPVYGLLQPLKSKRVLGEY